MTIAEQLERLAAAERAFGLHAEWRTKLVEALAIMDEKGKELHPGGQVGVWKDDWERMRELVLDVADDIWEHWDGSVPDSEC